MNSPFPGLVVGNEVGRRFGCMLRDRIDNSIVNVIDLEDFDSKSLDLEPQCIVSAPRRVTRPPGWLTGVGWVQLTSSGIDGYPDDILACPVLTNARGVTSDAVAEWVISAILQGELGLPFDRSLEFGSPRRLLSELTVGIVGLGSIGFEVAARLHSFGSRIVGLIGRTMPFTGFGMTLVNRLDELLPVVDVLVLAVPLSPDTRGMLSDSEFAMMNDVHLINVARGGLIEDHALRGALSQGNVRIASLDVTEPEPLPAGHWMLSHDSVRVSNHDSHRSASELQRLLDLVCKNVERFSLGESLINVVP